MRRIIVVLSSLLLASCVVHRLDVQPVDINSIVPITIETPVKAHLNDGSTVVFEDGVSVANNVVSGAGRRYDLTLEKSVTVTEVPLDDVAAMESYQTPVSTGATTAASAGSGIGILLGSMTAIMLIFGSCPTVYSFDGADAYLEAETFSYSIAPSFQSRDIDRLGITDPVGNTLELELRNEMLETHYIDSLQVLEISHEPGQSVYPDENGKPLTVGRMIAPTNARDLNGHDILPEVVSKDDEFWSAGDARFENISTENVLDHLDFEFDVAPGDEDIALVLRMRNSLLSTVLFYDVMLKQQNFQALEWMGSDLNRFANKAELGLWYRKQMGATVSVWKNGRYRKVARIGDQGPIAWSERAVRLPTHGGEKLKVRLSFVADAWRIDQIAVAENAHRAQSRTVPVAGVSGPEGDRDDIPRFLAKSDEEYLITKPQDWLKLSFDVGTVDQGKERAFFLASEGYYMEWMRADWLKHEKAQTFVPGDEALLQAIAIWADTRVEMREQFDSIKLAVR